MRRAERADAPVEQPPERERDGSVLCRRCGLCCDGTLFAHVPLEAGAEAGVRRRGLGVVTRDGKPALAQPCAALGAADQRGQRLCTLYAERPRCCAVYRCKLLDRHEAGDVALLAATAVIARARDMCVALRGRLGAPDASLSQRRARIDEHDADNVDWRRDHAELLMDLVLFQRLCDRHFLRPRARGAAPPSSER